MAYRYGIITHIISCCDYSSTSTILVLALSQYGVLNPLSFLLLTECTICIKVQVDRIGHTDSIEGVLIELLIEPGHLKIDAVSWSSLCLT